MIGRPISRAIQINLRADPYLLSGVIQISLRADRVFTVIPLWRTLPIKIQRLISLLASFVLFPTSLSVHYHYLTRSVSLQSSLIYERGADTCTKVVKVLHSGLSCC